MNPILSLLKKLGNLFAKAFTSAQVRGLTDVVLKDAVALVSQAAARFAATDNAEKREWVVKQLVARGVKESVARFAVEAAVQLYKAETTPAG